MTDYAKGRIQPGFIRYIVRRLLPGIACSAIVAGVCLAVLPKLDNSDVQLSRRWYDRPEWRLITIDKWLRDSPQVLNRPEPEIAELLLARFAALSEEGTTPRNEITHSELRVEDSPGNLTVGRQANQVTVCVYDRTGTPFERIYPISSGKPHGDPVSGAKVPEQ
jgi:hypothetical protein